MLKLDDTHPTITRLSALQSQLGESDSRFANRWLGTSPTTWLRVRQGIYAAQDQERVLAKLEGGLQQLEDHLESAGSKGQRGLLAFTTTRAVFAAIREALSEERNRLVLFRAPTGGGKTKLSHQIALHYTGRVVRVEATETWRESYLSATLAIAEAAGVRSVPSRKRDAENALIEELSAKPRILVIDEAHYLGQPALNLVKLLLNKSECVIVMLAIPILWERMQRSAWHEVEQLRTRTTLNLLAASLSARDVREFLSVRIGKQWTAMEGAGKEATALVQAACNRFGLWDTAERIASALLLDLEVGGPVCTPDQVRTAIAQTEMLRQ